MDDEMDDQYQRISAAYRQARRSPVSLYYEAPSVVKAIGDVGGSRVIDFACGEGFYTRILKQSGAATVVGVDLSPEMIALARQQEREAPLGIDYVVADAAQTRDFGRFDVATAIFLFNYARDVGTLNAMLATVARNLRDGGVLVAVVPNPDFVNGRKDTLPYGYFNEEIARHAALIEARMTFTEPRAFVIEYSQWSRHSYETALDANGFRGIGWRLFEVSAEGLDALGPAFWSAALDNPKSVILTATKIATP
jgi:toxoflavin synthase